MPRPAFVNAYNKIIQQNVNTIKSPPQQIIPPDDPWNQYAVNSGRTDAGCPGQGKAPAPPDPSKWTREAVAEDGRPIIYVSHEEKVVNGLAAKELANHPDLFQRGGYLVSVLEDQSPAAGATRKRLRPRIRTVKPATLREILSELIAWRKGGARQNGEIGESEGMGAHPPAHAVQALHSRGQWDGVPHLEGVVDYPAFTAKGGVLCHPGYDAETGLLQIYKGPSLSIPDNPTLKDAKTALDRLRETFVDFPLARLMQFSEAALAVTWELRRFHDTDQGRPIMILPNEAQPLLFALAPAFTTPTFQRFTTLMAAAILTSGRRTVANLLRTLGALARGHRSSYQRVLSQAQWSGLQLACLLTHFLLQHLLPQGVVRLVGDDTVNGHKGKKVHGKARRRQPLAKPRKAALDAPRQLLTVGWYGGGSRRVEVVTGTGCWYKSGRGLVPLRWVFVHDLDGTHRDE